MHSTAQTIKPDTLLSRPGSTRCTLGAAQLMAPTYMSSKGRPGQDKEVPSHVTLTGMGHKKGAVVTKPLRDLSALAC